MPQLSLSDVPRTLHYNCYYMYWTELVSDGTNWHKAIPSATAFTSSGLGVTAETV